MARVPSLVQELLHATGIAKPNQLPPPNPKTPLYVILVEFGGISLLLLERVWGSTEGFPTRWRPRGLNPILPQPRGLAFPDPLLLRAFPAQAGEWPLEAVLGKHLPKAALGGRLELGFVSQLCLPGGNTMGPLPSSWDPAALAVCPACPLPTPVWPCLQGWGLVCFLPA